MIKDIITNNNEISVTNNKMDKLKELFPNCFSKNGEFDITLFEEEIKSKTSILKEGYGLNFLGKNYAKYIASLDTETVLVPDEENNNKEENINSENIYISGDNIDALKHLVKSYANKIKCIYIDPPYNTGSDGFVYNDKFNLSIDKLAEVLDIGDEEAKRIYNMTNAKSNSHSAWLTFIYPRLYLAKQLLKEDGVIFISIDDNEQAQLKLLCDNIFGEENYIDTLKWKRKKQPSFLNKHTAKLMEYVLIYAKDADSLEKLSIDSVSDSTKKVINISNDYSVRHFKEGVRVKLDGKGVIKSGVYNIKTMSVEYLNDVYYEKGRTINEIDVKAKIQINQEKKSSYINEDLLFITVNFGLRRDVSEEESKKRKSITDLLLDYGDNQDSDKEQIKLFGSKVFDYSKPTKLISNLVKSTFTENEYILDFFSGSGSTAESVLNLNAEDLENRKFILVQLPEDLNQNLIKTSDTKSKEVLRNAINLLKQINKPQFLDEIGQERIRRASKRIKEETNVNIDYGFKHYTIKEVDTNTLDKLEKFDPNWFEKDKTVVDEFGINSILTTWMVKDGYGLTDKYEKLILEGYEAYKCKNTIYLINSDMSSESIKCLIEKYENEENFECNRIVLFGYSFTLSEIQTLKDNLKQVKNIKNINIDVLTRY